MSSTAVTLPASLSFLISNFHSFVNIKLDRSNYLLWKIQVENIVNANGFFGYLDGTVPCPEAEIRNAEGVTSVNPAYLLWKLIDTQLLSCLTASLSQATLPYVLGLTHAHQVWDSLSHRYNSLTKNHVQELKCRLYTLTKMSTMEKYIDTIKEYAQKLAAAGSPVDDDDLIFHTLRGLPKVFNGFKTAVRTRGNTITFDDLVTMLNGEDIQNLQETECELTSVLVVTQNANRSGIDASGVGNVIPQQFATEANSHLNNTMSQNTGSQNSFVPQHQSQNTYMPQIQNSFLPQSQSQSSFVSQGQNYQQNNRGFVRGRAGRGSRFYKDPCVICGKNNHLTQFCYYKGQVPQPYFQSQSFGVNDGSWRGPSYQQAPWFNGQGYSQGFHGVQNGQNQGFSVGPNGQFVSQGISTPIGQNGQFFSQGMSAPSQFQVPVLNGSLIPQTSVPRAIAPAQAHFTQAYNGPYMVPGSSQQINSGYTEFPTPAISYPANSGSSVSPWYFDSGATNHITNQMQNLQIAQPAVSNEGVLVGNGTNLQVTHTGQGYSQNSVQGPMPQGAVSTSELL